MNLDFLCIKIKLINNILYRNNGIYNCHFKGERKNHPIGRETKNELIFSLTIYELPVDNKKSNNVGIIKRIYCRYKLCSAFLFGLNKTGKNAIKTRIYIDTK